MIPLSARLFFAAETLLVHSEYIGVTLAPCQRALRLAGRGRRRGTVALCLWASHHVVAEAKLRDVLLSPDVARRLNQVAQAQDGQEARGDN